MSETNEPNQENIPNEELDSLAESINYDWRDPSKPRNPEDDVIVDGWQRRADGIFEKVQHKEAEQ